MSDRGIGRAVTSRNCSWKRKDTAAWEAALPPWWEDAAAADSGPRYGDTAAASELECDSVCLFLSLPAPPPSPAVARSEWTLPALIDVVLWRVGIAGNASCRPSRAASLLDENEPGLATIFLRACTWGNDVVDAGALMLPTFAGKVSGRVATPVPMKRALGCGRVVLIVASDSCEPWREGGAAVGKLSKVFWSKAPGLASGSDRREHSIEETKK